MAKLYRKSIRINGEVHTSPRFRLKKDADEWYTLMRRKKQFLRDGFIVEADATNEITVFEWARTWIKMRMENYPKATWSSDEQRLRDYVLPDLSDIPLSAVTPSLVRSTLKKISDEGKSLATRDRVKALMSALFGDAFNHEPPLIHQNPVIGLKFNDRRVGKAKPNFLEGEKACNDLLIAAKGLGSTHLSIVALGMMAALRKQEMLALRWSSFDEKKNQLLVSEKVEQVSASIKKGTKGGENVERLIPIPKVLTKILVEHRKQSKFKAPHDFILARKSDGRFIDPTSAYRFTKEAAEAAKVTVHVHGLRHTFGRMFAEKSGNMKALQAILGHSSSSTTDIYSNLAGDRLQKFSEVVSFKKPSNRVKRGGK